jgi:uncharacterized protein (DUF1778 family)
MDSTKMPARKYMTTRERSAPIRILTTDAEKRMLVRAAKRRDTPLSTYVREAALEKAKRDEAEG